MHTPSHQLQHNTAPVSILKLHGKVITRKYETFKYNTVQVKHTGTKKERKKKERRVVIVNFCYLVEAIQSNEGCHSQISSTMHLTDVSNE